MTMLSFSERDLKRGTVVEPAWYRVRIEDVGEKLAKNGQSTNYEMDATIIMNADNGSTTFKDVPVSWMFNSKAPGFAKGFFQAFGVELKADTRYDLKASIGREVEMFIGNKLYEGRTVNEFNHQYRPVKTA